MLKDKIDFHENYTQKTLTSKKKLMISSHV